jgi:hypothetical protein
LCFISHKLASNAVKREDYFRVVFVLSGVVPLLFEWSPHRSATLDSDSENVFVVPELKFGDEQGHVFFADLEERADYAAFENRPDAGHEKQA